MYRPTEFLGTVINASTKNTYKTALIRYLEILGYNVTKDRSLDEIWIDYLSHTINPSSDILLFVSQSQAISLSPKTIRLYGQIVIMYLKEAGIEISNKVLRKLRTQTPISRPISREAELTRDILQTLINNANLRLKTEILVAISSGMRIGELLKFQVQDIHLNSTPVEIYLRAESTKNKTARTVFISKETADALQQWLEFRETLVSMGKIHPNETRCFPYAKSTEIAKLKLLLMKCNLYEKDEQTHRTTIHFHLFRKYFLTEFKLAASAEVAEELAGHTGYLSDSYRRLTKKAQQEEYLKAERNLTIDNAYVELSDTTPANKESTPLQSPIPLTKQQSGIILQLQQQITELKSEIQALNSVLSQTLCDTK